MKRTEKYPETATFHFYNANPKNRYGGDCVIRAISAALEQSWDETVKELTAVGIKYGLVCNDEKCYKKYLKQKGWIQHPQPRFSDNKKYTGKEFCDFLKRFKNNKSIIAHIGTGHIVAIIDNKVNDIWDCTNFCIGNYWIKE